MEQKLSEMKAHSDRNPGDGAKTVRKEALFGQKSKCWGKNSQKGSHIWTEIQLMESKLSERKAHSDRNPVDGAKTVRKEAIFGQKSS
jgi:hypothetical protein